MSEAAEIGEKSSLEIGWILSSGSDENVAVKHLAILKESERTRNQTREENENKLKHREIVPSEASLIYDLRFDLSAEFGSLSSFSPY